MIGSFPPERLRSYLSVGRAVKTEVIDLISIPNAKSGPEDVYIKVGDSGSHCDGGTRPAVLGVPLNQRRKFTQRGTDGQGEFG